MAQDWVEEIKARQSMSDINTVKKSLTLVFA